MGQILIYAQYKSDIDQNLINKIKKISDLIKPDNIDWNPVKILNYEKSIVSIFNPIDTIKPYNESIYLGELFNHQEDWWDLTTEIPDGNFILFRQDKTNIQIANDYLGTRSLWYYYDEHRLIASSSQRIIIYLLGNFTPDKNAEMWFLSAGSLGPFFAWDSRIKLMRPRSVLNLEKEHFKITINPYDAIEFAPSQDLGQLEKKFEQEIQEHFKKYSIEPEKSLLLLSGGYDSRGVLYFLRKKYEKIMTITWGHSKSLENPKSDSTVAKKTAEFFGVENKFFATDEKSAEELNIRISRYIALSEARTDNFSAYTDGFIIWKWIHDSGYTSFIRSDEAFGWIPIENETGARRSVEAYLFSDYKIYNDPKIWGFNNKQKLPDFLEKKKNESVYAWRDRLYYNFRIPTILSALNYIKCNYAEIKNPLLFTKILKIIQLLPDKQRTDKKVWKRFVDKEVKLPIAKYPSIQNQENILKSQEMVDLIKTELRDVTFIPTSVLQDLSRRLVISEKTSQNKSFIQNIKEFLIRNFKIFKKLYYNYLVNIPFDANKICFRIFMISRFYKIINQDLENMRTSGLKS